MNKSERAQVIKNILDKTYPKTPIPLNHKDNFSLLVVKKNLEKDINF